MKNIISVFLIEDNEMYSMMLENSLKEIGHYRLKIFITAEEALKNMNLNPDVIVLDYYLPGLSGVDAMKKLNEAKPGVPIVVLSSQEEIQVALDVLKAGAYEYVIKNKYAAEKIFNSITQILSSNTIREENKQLKRENRFYKILLGLIAITAIVALYSMLRNN